MVSSFCEMKGRGVNDVHEINAGNSYNASAP